MTEDFLYAFRQTVGHEGGYINDKFDPGGETKFGISKRAYPKLLIAYITLKDARKIYYRDYWQPLRLDEVHNKYISAEIFDTAINMGRRTATRIVQKSLNYLGESLEVDGIIGKMTIATLNRWIEKDDRALYICLNGFQFIRYVAITARSDKMTRFARGWTRRIQDYRGDDV